MLYRLPNDMLRVIAGFLGINSLLAVQFVNKEVRRIMRKYLDPVRNAITPLFLDPRVVTADHDLLRMDIRQWRFLDTTMPTSIKNMIKAVAHKPIMHVDGPRMFNTLIWLFQAQRLRLADPNDHIKTSLDVRKMITELCLPSKLLGTDKWRWTRFITSRFYDDSRISILMNSEDNPASFDILRQEDVAVLTPEGLIYPVKPKAGHAEAFSKRSISKDVLLKMDYCAVCRWRAKQPGIQYTCDECIRWIQMSSSILRLRGLEW
jgi:hypothetical protein